MAFITGIFKLHNPSGWRREILNHVFEEYTLALADILAWSQDNLEYIRENGVNKNGKHTGAAIAGVLPKSKTLEADIASCLKESIVSGKNGGVGAILASYLELTNQDANTGFPTTRDPSPTGWQDTLEGVLDELGGLGDDLISENEARNRLNRQAHSGVAPISFVRSRDFAILTDKTQSKFFAWLKLLPDKHPMAQPVKPLGNLVNIETGEIFNYKGKSAVIIPLELGRRNGDWHWQYYHFIQPVLQGQVSIQTAQLMRDGDESGDYYLHVSFNFECPEPYEPEAYLGIDRGVFYSMAYGIVDTEGKIILMGHNDDGFRDERIQAGKRVQAKQQAGRKVTIRDYRRRSLDGILHVLVNEMIELARQHRAMIVTEDLNIQIRGKFYKSAWKKMYKILEYKCKLAGAPLWKKGVWANQSSQICIYCGEINRGRKRDGSPFSCPSCGAIYHSDEGAGVNIARRAIYRKKDWEDKGGYSAFRKSFANEATFGARIDLRQMKGVVESAYNVERVGLQR